jgi:hypothetical protein
VVEFHVDPGKAFDHKHGRFRTIVDNAPAGSGAPLQEFLDFVLRYCQKLCIGTGASLLK